PSEPEALLVVIKGPPAFPGLGDEPSLLLFCRQFRSKNSRDGIAGLMLSREEIDKQLAPCLGMSRSQVVAHLERAKVDLRQIGEGRVIDEKPRHQLRDLLFWKVRLRGRCREKHLLGFIAVDVDSIAQAAREERFGFFSCGN